MISYSTFSAVVHPGKRTRIEPISDIRLTMATFAEFKDESGRTTVRFYQAALPESDEEDEDEDEEAHEDDGEEKEIKFEDEPIVITHLTPGRVSLERVKRT